MLLEQTQIPEVTHADEVCGIILIIMIFISITFLFYRL